ncbi:conjugal transfer protein TraX [Lederbergia panacisoli]|uniref:conjugal transfer protein TraX n=1 Tax=Lederbergia panacisoli TaxID=1255251 RepID=UPI00214C8466|nr:conjugal transfer protein TraX [Lederbergia panacisoli]MCR2822222.1 conjugal transfer protein TraX [Lederbergia panacisoli]
MTATFIKLIAVVSMFIDHTGQFIPNTPEYLRYIGRTAAPIFIYFVGIGYRKTSDKKKYMLRLYVASIVMAFINLIINSFYSDSGNFITNNFFATLFLTVVCIHILEKRKMKLYVYFVLWQIISTFLCILFSEIIVIIYRGDYSFYSAIFGNLLFVEGGIFFVIFGVLLYWSKNKVTLSLTFIMFSLFIYLAYSKWGGKMDPSSWLLFPFADYQWIMITSLPLLLLYNGKRGTGLKYFFYFFYPIHIIIFYFIGENLR